MNKKIVIGVGILVGVVAVLMVTGVFKFNVSVSPSGKEAAQKEFVLPEGWQKYTSGEFGYAIAHPSDWNLKENNNAGARELLVTAPGGSAFVRVAGFVDPSVNSVVAIEASMAEYKASFDSKPNELLNEFKTEIQGQAGGFGASGRMKVNGLVYQFLERGLLAVNGRVLIMRGAVDTTEANLTQEQVDDFGKTVRQVMDSFRVQ
ncbi:MAG: hypothetical protein HYW96_00055 [Candidatus Wildermuthbacteria bacterium]|nr:hypothetical protein [Candidatus Wildermuthbacteria bacterium]